MSISHADGIRVLRPAAPLPPGVSGCARHEELVALTTEEPGQGGSEGRVPAVHPQGPEGTVWGEAGERLPVRPWDVHVPEIVPSGSRESPPAVTSLLFHPEACAGPKGAWEADLKTPPHSCLSRAGLGRAGGLGAAVGRRKWVWERRGRAGVGWAARSVRGPDLAPPTSSPPAGEMVPAEDMNHKGQQLPRPFWG